MADILDLEVVQDESMVIDDAAVDDGIAKLKESAKVRKGRGFNASGYQREVFEEFESLADSGDKALDARAQRSVEGFILMVTGIHEEAHEDDVYTKFSEYGDIKNLHLNLDRRTGFLKGYALVEYEKFDEAQQAKSELNGTEILGVKINVDWAFVKKPPKTRSSRRH